MTRRPGFLLALLAVGAVATALPAQTRPAAPADIAGVHVDGRVARAHISALSDGIGPRMAGTDGERKAAAYIAASLRASGYPTTVQAFTYTSGRSLNRDRAGGDSRTQQTLVESANVIAVKAGRSTREIVIGAHYDSTEAGRGADDNASGVAVMLEVAAALRDVSVPYTLRFVAFGAEEVDEWGSRRFVERMSPAAVRNTECMINLDSLVAGDVAYVYGTPGDKGVVRDWVLRRAADGGLALQTQGGENPDYPAGTTGPFSDHAAFEGAGIQYAYFESTNWALGDKDGYVQVDPRFGDDGYIWHTEHDTLDYLDRAFPGRVDHRLELYSGMLLSVLTEFVSVPEQPGRATVHR